MMGTGKWEINTKENKKKKIFYNRGIKKGCSALIKKTRREIMSRFVGKIRIICSLLIRPLLV